MTSRYRHPHCVDPGRKYWGLNPGLSDPRVPSGAIPAALEAPSHRLLPPGLCPHPRHEAGRGKNREIMPPVLHPSLFSPFRASRSQSQPWASRTLSRSQTRQVFPLLPYLSSGHALPPPVREPGLPDLPQLCPETHRMSSKGPPDSKTLDTPYQD